MSELITRVTKEQEELASKIEKLEAFLTSEEFEGLAEEHRILLTRQRHHMQEYAGVLGERLVLLTK